MLVDVTNSSVSGVTLVGHNRTSLILELSGAPQHAEPAHRQLRALLSRTCNHLFKRACWKKRKNLTFVKFRAIRVSLLAEYCYSVSCQVCLRYQGITSSVAQSPLPQGSCKVPAMEAPPRLTAGKWVSKPSSYTHQPRRGWMILLSVVWDLEEES